MHVFDDIISFVFIRRAVSSFSFCGLKPCNSLTLHTIMSWFGGTGAAWSHDYKAALSTCISTYMHMLEGWMSAWGCSYHRLVMGILLCGYVGVCGRRLAAPKSLSSSESFVSWLHELLLLCGILAEHYVFIYYSLNNYKSAYRLKPNVFIQENTGGFGDRCTSLYD